MVALFLEFKCFSNPYPTWTYNIPLTPISHKNRKVGGGPYRKIVPIREHFLFKITKLRMGLFEDMGLLESVTSITFSFKCHRAVTLSEFPYTKTLFPCWVPVCVSLLSLANVSYVQVNWVGSLWLAMVLKLMQAPRAWLIGHSVCNNPFESQISFWGLFSLVLRFLCCL